MMGSLNKYTVKILHIISLLDIVRVTLFFCFFFWMGSFN